MNVSAEEYAEKGSKDKESKEHKQLVKDRIKSEKSEVRFADIKARSDKLRTLQKQLSSKQGDELVKLKRAAIADYKIQAESPSLTYRD